MPDKLLHTMMDRLEDWQFGRREREFCLEKRVGLFELTLYDNGRVVFKDVGNSMAHVIGLAMGMELARMGGTKR